jgi:hypothetical protein
MRTQRYLALGLALLSLALCLGVSLAWAADRAAVAATDPLGNINRLPAALEHTVGRLRNDLNANGFAVARGYWTLWGVNDCKYPIQTLGYCYGNNPTAPYVLAVVPQWNDEYVDQKFHHILNDPLPNMSANHRLDQREALVIVAQLLVRAGASRSEVFTEPVSPELVKVGLDQSADDLITYIRYAMPLDEAAGERWRQELPLTILRVRDMSSRKYDNPLPIPIYYKRTFNYDETKLGRDFAALQGAVLAKWAQPQATLLTFFSAYKSLDLIGQHCLGYGYPDPNVTRGPMDCLGDTQDADYQISASGQIDGDQVIAVVGTLSTETGNATYTSLSVNWFPELVGVANIDNNDLHGTAASFARALPHPNTSDLFYVYYIARNCTGLAQCIEIPTKLVPTGGLVKFIQRNYVSPGSRSGPDPDKILNPVAFVLDGRNRPRR